MDVTHTKEMALADHHRAYLHTVGLKDETIAAGGLYTETDHERLTKILAYNSDKLPKKLVPALVIPYRDQTGFITHYRVRPDEPRQAKGLKVEYEKPHGSPTHVYITPGVYKASHSGMPLHLVVGEIEAAFLDQEGFPAIGLTDFSDWRAKAGYGKMVPFFSAVSWIERVVRLIAAPSIETDEEAEEELQLLAALMADREANVQIVRVPPANGGHDQSPGAYLKAHGADAFKKLLASDGGYVKATLVATKPPASKMDPCDEAWNFYGERNHLGTPVIVPWADSFWLWSNGAYSEVAAGDMRGEVIRYLDDRFTHVQPSAVNSLLDHLRAYNHVLASSMPPLWIGKGGEWPAEECIVASNGIFHLPSLAAGDYKRLPLTPKLFTSTALDYEIKENPPEPKRFSAFLKQLWPDDRQSIECLQEWFGYLLSTDTSLQKILLIIGPPRSGKGTLARILSGLVGPKNVASPALADLTKDYGLQGLIGKSVALIHDARLSGWNDRAVLIERLLSISGEDSLDIGRKYLPCLSSVRLPTRAVMTTNEWPRLKDASGAVTSRFVPLRLTRSFLDHEDTELTDKLLQELPGIFRWAVEGYRRLNERKPKKFIVPRSSRELMQEMEELASPVAAFVADCCSLAPTPRERDQYRVRADVLFEAFQKWLNERGASYSVNRSEFGRELRVAASVVDRCRASTGSRHWEYAGIRLKNELTVDQANAALLETAQTSKRNPRQQRQFRSPVPTPS